MAKATRYTPELIDRYIESGDWQKTTFADVWDHNALTYPEKEALVDWRLRLTQLPRQV